MYVQLGIHLQRIQKHNEQKGFKVSNKFFYTFSYKLLDCSPTDMKLCFLGFIHLRIVNVIEKTTLAWVRTLRLKLR